MLDRAIAADLYLDLLVPWETKIKALEPKGNFDLRAKAFTEFKRTNSLQFKVEKTGADSDLAIRNLLKCDLKAEQIVIVAKGDNSGARSLLRHTRNSVAHAHARKVKIKNKNFIVFSASNRNKQLLYAQIQVSKLKDFLAAMKSTVKNV
ncbi:HEPN family nuclease [Alteromonas macleodii]|uniref:HEPN family nuclease n=1 Tax=Alteromonas macleodii TaxID=28108 RepID=UPI003140AA29